MILIPIGTKITVFTSNAIAMTVCHRWTITGGPQPTPPGSDSLRIGVGKPQGKRKEFHVSINPGHALVFEGWEVPFCADSDAVRPGGQSIWGNGCINLCGEAAVIREWIETKNLNDGFKAKDEVIIYPPSGQDMLDKDGVLLYPDASTSHAVIRKLREASAVTA